MQEVKERLPGRGVTIDVAALAKLLHETAEHHGSFEAVAPARLVGLVRGVHGRSRARAHPRGGLRGRRALHGGGQARCRLARLNWASAIEPLDDELVAFWLL